MGKFISDADMAKLESSEPPVAEHQPGRKFISDAAMEHLEAPMGWGEYLGRGLTGALPIVGGAAAGAAGTSVAGPLAGVAAGAAGYTAGKGVENLANHYLFGDDSSQVPIAASLDEGAKMEMGGQGLTKALSPVAAYISKRLGHAAESATLAHLKPTLGVKRNLGEDGLHAAAREALDSGSIQPFRKASTTAANLADRLDEVGAVKGDIVNASKAQINPNEIAARVQNEVVASLRSTSESQPLANTISKKADSLLKQYPGDAMTPAQLEAEKMAVAENTTHGLNSSAKNDALKDYGRVLKEGVENAIDDPAFTAAKKSFGNLTKASEMADRTAAATEHHIPHSLGGIPAALTKGRLSSTLATGANALSKVVAPGSKISQTTSDPVFHRMLSTHVWTPGQLSKIAESPYGQVLRNAAQSGGDDAVSTTHYILQQTDPHYQDLLKKEQE